MTQYQTTENSVISLKLISKFERSVFHILYFIGTLSFGWKSFCMKWMNSKPNSNSARKSDENTLLKLQNVAYCWIVEDEFFCFFSFFIRQKKKHNANGLNTQWVKTNARNTQRYRFVSDNVLTSTVLCHCSTLNINRLRFHSTMEPISSR